MSTVDEVLATAEVVDAVCVIDGETRIISVPNEYKELGVESDEKVTRIKFQCPKIVGDNVDLTEYNLYINYRNAANKLNSYLVEDVTVTGDNITFSWLLSRHVTERPGTISYIVCAKKSDYTGVINEWNTKVATGTVGIGLEATEEIEEQNIDIIEQILRSIVELENSTGGSGVSDYDLLDNKPIANITSTTNNVISLRDLPTGVYRLSGDFIPYAGSNYSFSFTNKQLVNVITNTAGTHVQIFYPIDNTVQFMSIMVDPTAEDGYSLEQTNVKLNDLQTKSQVVTISLPAASWVEEGSVYKQTVTISSATPTSQVDLRPSQEQLQNMIASGISLMTANDNGTVTVFSIGGVPESDYSIQAIVSEANTVGGTSGSGSGLSSNAKTLLIAILRNAIYNSDQSENITELEVELERTSDGGGAVTYTVESNLTNVTSDNTKVLVDANASYTATLTADDGCVLDVVTVIMGGEDVTASVYADGVITIPAVTGDVIITATAIAPNADILATTTWTDGVRVNNAGDWTGQTNRCASDYIAVEAGDIITIMLKDGVTGNKSVEYGNFNADKKHLKSGGSELLSNSSDTYSSSMMFTVGDSTAYIRISYGGTSSNIIITATRQRGSV